MQGLANESQQSQQKNTISLTSDEALRLERERLNIIFQNTTISIWDYFLATRQLVQTARSQEVHGLSAVIDNVPESLIESGFVHPDSVRAYREMYDRLHDGEKHVSGIFRVKSADGSGYYYEHIRYNLLENDEGQAYVAVGMSTDVTKTMETIDKAERWKTMLMGVLGNQGAVIEFNLSEGKFISIENSLGGHEPSWSHYSFDEYVAAYCENYVYPPDRELVKGHLLRDRLLKNYEDGLDELSIEYRLCYLGAIYWVNLSVKLIYFDAEDTVHIYMLHSDITKSKEKELALRRQADRDPVTDLLNFRAFSEQVEKVFANADGRSYIMLMIDIDKLKSVNDNYGRSTGDALLRYVAKCLTDITAEFGETALIGRSFGDDFVLLFYHDDRGRAERYLQELRTRLAKPAVENISLTLNAGLAIYPQDGQSMEEISMATERAVYHIKHHGSATYCFYDNIWYQRRNALLDRQQMISDTISGGMMGGYMVPGFPFYFVDESMLRWLGYASEAEFVHDIDGMIANLIHEEDIDYVMQSVDQQFMRGDTYAVDYRLRKKDGSYIWVHDVGRKVLDEQGRAAIMAVCYDVTVEKEHAQLIERLVNDANGAIALYRVEEDWKLTLIYASERLGKMAGYNDAEYLALCGSDAICSVYETDRAAVLQAIKKAITNDVALSIGYRMPHRDGGNIWVNGTFSKYVEDNGRPVLRVVFMPLPIQYELQLQTLDSDTLGVYVIDRATKELYYANNASFKLHDIEDCDITGKTCHEVYYNCDGVCSECLLSDVAENGKTATMRTRGDRIISLEMQTRRWNGKDIAIIYCRDVTVQMREQKKQDELLNRIPIGLCLYRFSDDKFEPLAFNSTLAEVLGLENIKESFDVDELLYKQVHPDDLNMMRQSVRKCIVSCGKNYSCRYRMWNSRQHAYIWLEAHYTAIARENDVLLYATYSDITETSQAQESLKNSRDALNALIKYGNLGLWSYDLDTRRVVQEYSDYGAYGSNIADNNVPDSYIERKIVHPDDAAEYRACYQRLLDGRAASDCIVRILADANVPNKYLWMHIFLTRQLKTQDGRRRAIGFSIVVEDEVNSIRKLEETQDSLKNMVYELTNVQNRLEQSRKMVEAACAFADIWIFSYDIDHGIIYTSEKIRQDFGVGDEIHNVPESIFEYKLVVPEYEALCRQQFSRLRAGETHIDFDIKVLLADKKLHWMRIKGQLLSGLDNGGRIAAVSAQVIDTEKVMEARLALERKKQQSENRSMLFYYVANLSTGMVTEYKNIKMDNPRYPEDLSLDNLINKECRYLAFQEDCEHIKKLHRRENLLNNYRAGIVYHDYKTHIIYRDGQIVWIRNVMQLLQSPNTGDILLYEYVYDVNENQLINVMLQMEMNYGYEVIGNLFSREDQFVFIDISPTSGKYELHHARFSDYVRAYAEQYLHPEDKDKYISHYDELPNSGAQRRFRSELLYRTFDDDGSIRYHKDDNYFYDEQKGIFLLTRRDYTDVVRAEEKEKQRLADALVRAEEAGRAKSDFLARMSHDMRTPMNAITGLTALTIDVADNPEEVRSNMVKMHAASDFLLGLVNDILDMSKLESHTLSMNLGNYLYNDFLMNLRTTFLPQCEAKGIKLTFKKPEINPLVRCDKIRLNQIFYNIISNAIKYTPAGGTIDYDVKNLRLENNKISADYIITDSGIGMSEEFQQKMFEPFTRENNAYTAELQGSGLGLSITRQLVEMMGGTIKIISGKDKGTKVIVSLSFECLAYDAKMQALPTQSVSADTVLRGRVVLLAEDHPLNADIATRLLEKRDMTVLRAVNGRIAVEMFNASAENSIDIVLMDIRMPEMDGLEAATAIRKLARPDAASVPIVAMSANAYPEDVQKSLSAGMNAHLSKPINIEAMFSTIKKFLADK